EAHVHRALDLTYALQRVHRPTHVVGRHDPFDRAALPVDDHELGRVTERGVDHRVLDAGRDRARPVDAVLAGIVDPDAATVVARGPARGRDRPRAHQRSARTGGLARAELARRVDHHPDAL